MTEANNIPVVEDDLNTTAPQSEPEVWKMPEPVFRRTSGKLPQGFTKSVEQEPAEPSREDDTPTVDASQVSDTRPEEPKPKSPVLKIVVVVLGLGAMVGFLIAFLTAIYFLFLARNGE